MKKLLILGVMALFCGCSVLSGPICSDESAEIAFKIKDSKLAAVLHFADGKANLTKGDLEVIKGVAQKAIETDANVLVYGHASHHTRTKDPIQRMIVNIEVSNDRAVNTAKALMDAGVPAERINSVALFDSRPVRKEVTRADQAANRRSEIYLYWFE